MSPRSGKLRFAIMCTGERLEAAFADCVDQLLRVDGVELALLIIEADSPVRITRWQRFKRIFSLKGILWPLYLRLIPTKRLPCIRPVDMSHIFGGVPRIHCRVLQRDKFGGYFRPEDVKEIRSYRLDFILHFAFGIIGKDMLKSAKYGVWSFHYGDESKYRSTPPAFWEIYHQDPTTAAILYRLTDQPDGGVVLHKCLLRTNRYSYAANLNGIMRATTHMPARTCRDLLNGCAHYLQAAPNAANCSDFAAPLTIFRCWCFS